ncbi:hypothetical protein Bca101_089455 [Brassica carinata]
MSCMGARMGLGMFAGELGSLNLEDMLNAASPDLLSLDRDILCGFFFLSNFYDSSIGKITKLKKKITAAASAFTSVFDKKEMQQQGPSNELDQLKDRMEKVLNVFCDVDTTEFVIVTIPTVMAINESSGLHASLRKENVPVHRLIGGAHNPDDDKHGKKCASSKFHFGVSSGCNPPEGGDEPKEPSDAEGTIPNSEQ